MRSIAFYILSTVLIPAAAQPPPSPTAQSQAELTAKMLAIGPSADPAAAKRGKQFFGATCSFCHGADARGGDGGPDLVRSILVLHDENGSTIGPVILAGRPAKGMPSFASMPKERISDIAAFLKSRYQAAANRGAYEFQKIATGDAKAGKAYFDAKCAGCHSPTGDLAGVASKFDETTLQSVFLYPLSNRGKDGKLSAKAAPTVTVTLPSGESISGVLDHLDDFEVALTDFAGGLHSWPLNDGTAASEKTVVAVHDPLAAHVALLKQYSDADMHNILTYLETLK
ncbi:MAG TPA: c-type cytochrome [Bryobacteraceae bacterium]|jgi:mono/diheme cytochrome c family protein